MRRRSRLALCSGSGGRAASRANAGDGLGGSVIAAHGRADADVIDAATMRTAAQAIHAMR
jgi:hypothetical protein